MKKKSYWNILCFKLATNEVYAQDTLFWGAQPIIFSTVLQAVYAIQNNYLSKIYFYTEYLKKNYLENRSILKILGIYFLQV